MILDISDIDTRVVHVNRKSELDMQNLTRRCHEALIMAVVAEEPRHGYQLALEIEQRSHGFFRFNCQHRFRI